MHSQETGPEFEDRALAIARAIYDPSGTQGSVMFRGREHDGVFVDERSIVAFEFTQLGTKAKAHKDAVKIRDVLKYLSELPDNRYKSAQGFLVTLNEPTGEQRSAVQQIAEASKISIKALSVVALRSQLIDSARYLALRRQAPFGSTAYKLANSTQSTLKQIETYVEPNFVRHDNMATRLDEIVTAVDSGAHVVITADFGSGKSEALKQAFERLRKRYFKDATVHKLPVHVNLRECYGLRSPREVLRRHAEEIGFPNENSLVAAWRSGNCSLLLDGFDELLPARWVGGAKDLRQVRRQALEAVRRLVEETPDGCGVMIAGRPQYFADMTELAAVLGINVSGVVKLLDFDDERVERLTGHSAGSLPEWVPTRPLLLKFLLQAGLLDEMDMDSFDPAVAWRAMLDVLATREAERVSSVTPESIHALIGRVATLAKGSENGLGLVTLTDMRAAFRDICGYEPDEEGLQLLLRLPGLAAIDGAEIGEARAFVDDALAEAAYGEDLGAYAIAPFAGHPLADGVAWTAASGALAINVAAHVLTGAGFDPGAASAAIKRRSDSGYSDAVLLDLVAVADLLGAKPVSGISPFFSELLIRDLYLPDEPGYLASSTFKDCILERLVVGESDGGNGIPMFQSCIIGCIDGWSRIPDTAGLRFVGTDVGAMSAHADTTAGILELNITSEARIGLIILKKVYAQAGSARRESSLPRGLPPSDRGLVPAVISALVSAQLLVRTQGRKEPLLAPVKGGRARAMAYLSSPHSFSLESLS